MPDSSSFALTDAIVFTGDVFVENQAVLVRNKRIIDLVPNGRIPSDFAPLSCVNAVLAPAYIDCQVNGGGNVLFNAAPTAEAAIAIARAHERTGTTRLLPTCVTDKPDITRAAIAAARAARGQHGGVLGIHLEGPHISLEKKGAHNGTFIRPLEESDVGLYRPEADEILLITLAPETAPPEMIARLTAQGAIVALGHSAATAAQTRASLDAGARGFTHLFNAMPPAGGREPTIAAVALDDEKAFAGIIGDLVHVAPEMLRLAARGKAGTDKLFLVSDAMPPAGADAALPFDLCGMRASTDERACYLESGGLCGARLTLGECVARCIAQARLDPALVLRMAGAIPAAFLGLGKELGRLLPQYKADIVMLDHAFKAQKVWREGVLCDKGSAL